MQFPKNHLGQFYLAHPPAQLALGEGDLPTPTHSAVQSRGHLGGM